MKWSRSPWPLAEVPREFGLRHREAATATDQSGSIRTSNRQVPKLVVVSPVGALNRLAMVILGGQCSQ